MEKYTYTKEHTISYSLIDRTGRLGLVELMNLNQDMITEFFGYIGSDNAILRDRNNAAWIYTRSKVMVKQLPIWNTKVIAKSFVCAVSSIRLEVETDFFDQEGKLLFAVKTEICAIDFEERKIRKIETLTFPKDMNVIASNMTEGFEKIKTKFDLSDLIYQQYVFASDIDFTNHTNNARYVKFLMNTMDAAFYEEKTVTSFEIQFVKESKENNTLDVFKKDIDGETVHFLIKNEEEILVKAVLTYEDAGESPLSLYI